MYNKFTEPDMFKHIGNERNTLVCTRIDIEGLRDQRVVLTVPVTKLRYFEDYTLVIRQPIPHAAQGLPLYRLRRKAPSFSYGDIRRSFL